MPSSCFFSGFSSPTITNTKKRGYLWYSHGKVSGSYIHIPSTSLRDASVIWGTLPRPKNMPLACFLNGLSSPSIPHTKKERVPLVPSLFWCERWDSNPHGETTRTSNVLVYHSNTLANDLSIITFHPIFVNNFLRNTLRRMDISAKL